MLIDAKGKACPIPVVMAKKELDAGCDDLTVAVDNATAVANLTRLAESRGLQLAVDEQNGLFSVRMYGKGEAPAPAPAASCAAAGDGYAIFIGKDHLGEGDPELGYNLLKMAIYTLSQSEQPPACIVFMNSGVKLPAGGEQQIIDNLNQLIARGSEVLVCGTCLNFYQLTDQLKAGQISNMYDILDRLRLTSKVISL